MGYTAPTWIKSKPHASAEKQVGDSDPSARIDVINRVEKGYYAVIRRILTTLGFDTVDFTDQTTVTSLGGPTVDHLHITGSGGVKAIAVGAAFAAINPTNIGVQHVGGNDNVVLTDNQSITITLYTGGLILITETLASGFSALFHASYGSTTITEISDPTNKWSTTDVDGNPGMAIFKDQNSNIITVKNYFNATVALAINVLSVVAATTAPA